MKTFADVLRNFQKRKRRVPACRYARIVAEISKGNVQAEQIARATGDGIKNVQNRLGELREAGIIEATSKMPSGDGQFPNPHGRSRIEWRIAA